MSAWARNNFRKPEDLRTVDVNNLTLPEGYQMPFSLEAEQAVLGCVLMDPNCMPQVLIYLRPEYFYLPQHREIFSVMVSLDALGSKIDPLVILEALKNNGTYDEAAGKNYLFQLAQSVPTTSNVESYSKIVREKYFMRTPITVSQETIDNAVAQTVKRPVFGRACTVNSIVAKAPILAVFVILIARRRLKIFNRQYKLLHRSGLSSFQP